jgi:hypothetical protein
MLFSVGFETRLAAAPTTLRFFFGATFANVFAAGLAEDLETLFFRAVVFGFAARFRLPAEDDPPPGRLRVDLAEVIFCDLAPVAFAGFLVDFLRAAIKLSTQDRLLAPLQTGRAKPILKTAVRTVGQLAVRETGQPSPRR